MATTISNSGADERGKYSGGQAGDNTGGEWKLCAWYSRPWNCILRHPEQVVRAKLADLSRLAAENDHIGYDQLQRGTYWQQLQKVGYDPSKITADCEADCSAGVIANTKAAGILLGYNKLKNIAATYTGNMRSAYKAAGFEVLTDSKYLTTSDYLLPGDILLNDAHHVAVNITAGAKAGSGSTSTSSASELAAQGTGTTGTNSAAQATTTNLEVARKSDTTARKGKVFTVNVRTGAWLNMRYGAGTSKGIIKTLQAGEKVTWYGYYNVDSVGSKWYLVVDAGRKVGYVHAGFLREV